MDQGNSKHGRAHDEALKHETAGHGVDPDELPGAPLVGGVPPGMTQEDVAERSVLASHLGQAVYPAARDDLLARLDDADAPEHLASAVATLPADREFHNVQELAVALGLAVEKERF